MTSQHHFLGSMTLKALLEDPNLKNPPIIGQSDNPSKVKKEDGGSDRVQYNYGSAFLGPTLWDKSYGMDLNLEYMDLDEFLSENDIPGNGNGSGEEGLAGIELDASKEDEDPLSIGVNTPPNPVVSSPRQYLRTPPVSPSHYTINGSSVTPISNPAPSQFPTHPAACSVSPPHHGHASPSSTPPSSPSVKVDFQVSDQDLALTSIPDYEDPKYYPGGWMQGGDGHRPKMGASFDPRKRNFSEEELKPQPIIKKSKKIFVPDELKDDRYWARRVKNNYAAKRSRDARRVKENQIALRAAYLEKENECLKEEMAKLRKENSKLKTVVEKYEPGTTVTGVSSSTGNSWPALSP